MGTKERIGIQTNDGLLTVKKARYILCHFKGFQLVVTVLSSLNYFVIFSIAGITNETNDNQFSFLLFFQKHAAVSAPAKRSQNTMIPVLPPFSIKLERIKIKDVFGNQVFKHFRKVDGCRRAGKPTVMFSVSMH